MKSGTKKNTRNKEDLGAVPNTYNKRDLREEARKKKLKNKIIYER